MSFRYQPDLLYGKPGCNREKDCLTSPEGESELTESESHINMLKEGSSTLQTVLKPPLVPTEQSSSVVNMAVCLLGMHCIADLFLNSMTAI